ncbi:transposase [Microbacterium trichothecenolyticum]|uniref:Transposase n=1 Tax=Microbacterium trichothecenolyticum TaxID=69370 RepID=A0ABU0TZ52_MICTR|nr:transposase [Microbacterium trichothecenolyticum]
MPKPYPKEFRDDVVRVAENREPGMTIERIAADFGVHPMTLMKWLARSRAEKIASETGSPSPSDCDAELRELRQRNRLLEQEVEVLRRATAYLSQAHLPGKGSTRS